MVRRLPPSYIDLVEWLNVIADTNSGVCFRGPVGFDLHDVTALRHDGAHVLGRKRWSSMHYALVPFAQDGAGNRFCFRLRRRTQGARRAVGNTSVPVWIWMYETGCALPLTTDFERFISWIGLYSHFSLQQRNELNLSREQFDEEVRPLLERFDTESILERSPNSYGATSRDLTREMLIIDQDAPGFLLARAATRQARNRGDVSRRLAERAIQSEPDFTAALELLCYLDDENPVRAFEALGSALAFTGDARAPSLAGIPRLDLHRLAETVHTCGGRAPAGLRAIRDIVDIDNLAYTKAWLHTSSDFAEHGDVDRAAASASNGLFMATTRAERMQCLVALRDIFDKAGDAFFADMLDENVAQYRRRKH